MAGNVDPINPHKHTSVVQNCPQLGYYTGTNDKNTPGKQWGNTRICMSAELLPSFVVPVVATKQRLHCEENSWRKDKELTLPSFLHLAENLRFCFFFWLLA